MHEKLPLSIKIGPYLYRVKLVENLRDPVKKHKLFGSCNSVDHTILIDVACTEDRARAVLMHECLHALWEITALPLKATEEDAIVCLSPALTALLLDNPDLREYYNGQ